MATKRAPWKAPVGGGDFGPPAPAGLHQGVLADIIDRGPRLSTKYGTVARKVSFRYFLNSFDEETEKQHRIDDVLTFSMNEKAKMRSRVESIIGRDLSDEEAENFDPQELIGMNCQVLVTHRPEGGRTYANVKNLMGPAKGAPTLEIPEDYEPEVVNYKSTESWPVVNPKTKRPLTDGQLAALTAMVEGNPSLRANLDEAIATVVGMSASAGRDASDDDEDPFEEDYGDGGNAPEEVI